MEAGSKDIQNTRYKVLAELAAFTDLAACNVGLPQLLSRVLSCQLRFYATQADSEDYELLGDSSVDIAAGSSSSSIIASLRDRAASRLGRDRSLLNKLGSKTVLLCETAKGDYQLFQHHVSADQRVFLVANDVLLPDHIEFVLTGLHIYASQARLLKRITRDNLTNLLNRDAFEKRMRSLYSRNGLYRRRSGEQRCNGCLAIADIDNFKHLNNDFGHVYGDSVLVTFAQIMRDSFRDDDLLCRLGGEEFVIVLSDVDVNVAMNALQRFKNTVAATEFPQGVKLTVSLGCAQLNMDTSLDVMTTHADKALDYAKTHGRNQLCLYEDLRKASQSETAARTLA